MKRKSILNIAGVFGAGGIALSSPSFAENPNVLLFTADDLGCESVGAFGGSPQGMTPHLDAFALEGMMFTKAHVNCAICSPSRAIITTGLYGHNSGAMGFSGANRNTPTVVSVDRKSVV